MDPSQLTHVSSYALHWNAHVESMKFLAAQLLCDDIGYCCSWLGFPHALREESEVISTRTDLVLDISSVDGYEGNISVKTLNIAAVRPL